MPFIFISFSIFAQTKTEFEKKVDESKVPSIAVEGLHKCFTEDVKIKWYFQKDGKKEVYEAKFDNLDKFFSVEFDVEGDIENVEILVDKKDLDKLTKERLENTLSAEFKDFEIVKIQKEYLGDEDELIKTIEGQIVEDIITNFEIEVNAKIDKRRQLYELMINENFEIKRKRKIKLQSTDILDY